MKKVPPGASSFATTSAHPPHLRQPTQHAGGGVDEVEFAVDSVAGVVDVALDELDVRVGLGSEVAGVVE